MRRYRNFVPYYDYCRDCMPYLYGRQGCEPWSRGVGGYQPWDRTRCHTFIGGDCRGGVFSDCRGGAFSDCRGGTFSDCRGGAFGDCRTQYAPCVDKQCACDIYKGCYCPRQEVMFFASFINADKCSLKCGDAIKFKRVLASEGCGWKCSSDCIELARGAYMIFVSGLQSNKCGGTLAICCNDEKVKGGHTYLSSSHSPFCINVMLKIEKCANISVRNISDSIINIELAKLNILRLV